MLIVAFSMMFAALLIFLLWNLFIKCRAFWLARKSRGRRRRGAT
jgi:hypothetical protein